MKNTSVAASAKRKPTRAAKIFGALSILISGSFVNPTIREASQLKGLYLNCVKPRMKKSIKSTITNTMLPVIAYSAIIVAIKKPVIRTVFSLTRNDETGQTSDFKATSTQSYQLSTISYPPTRATLPRVDPPTCQAHLDSPPSQGP